MPSRTVTRADLADAVYRLELSPRDAEQPEPFSREECAHLVESVLREMMDRLASGEAVKISSFGTFVIREKSERMGRNPKTGEEAVISPRRVLSFRASQVLKDRLNGASK